MLKATTWSLLSGGVLAAGAAYVFAQRARVRRAFGGSTQRSLVGDVGENNLVSDTQASTAALEEPALGDIEELEIELVDIDSMAEEEEGYDASSPDDLGALWLSRATQTSGERASPGIENDGLDDEDELDPAGRPTEPPQVRMEATNKEPR